MTDNSKHNNQSGDCDCHCHKGGKHCTWATAAVVAALVFSLLAFATSLCAVHGGDHDGWRHHGRGPMMRWDGGFDRGQDMGPGMMLPRAQVPRAGKGQQQGQAAPGSGQSGDQAPPVMPPGQ